MPFGPIVDAELTRLARQKRWYVLRFALGLGLLFLLYAGYQNVQNLPWGRSSMGQEWVIRMAANQILGITLVGQSIVVFFLAPMLTAGAIAEEKQRKTLHYLLASRLSGAQIVVGKLAARLLLVVIPVAMAVPVVIIAAILGGLDLEILLAIYGLTLATVVFEASLAILISVLARRGREALLLTFLVGAAWFLGPVLLETTLTDLREPWPSIYHRWIEPINDTLLELTPLGVVRGPMPNQAAVYARVRSTMVHQALGSAALLALATWWLRPAFRRQGGASARGRIGRLVLRRWWPRRPVGDDPMLWKETHGTRGSRLVALISLLTVASVVLMAHDSFKRSIPESWRAFRDRGYEVGLDDPRNVLNGEVRVAAAGLFGVWSILMMVAAATSVSREREDDTWISLVSTPLEARAILGAKLVGAAWSCRHLAYATLALVAAGAAIGAVHPLGALVAAAQLAAFGLFLLAVGTLISIRSRTTSAALGAGIVVLVLLGLLTPMMVAALSDRPGPGPFVTSQPALVGMGLVSYADIAHLDESFRSPNDTQPYQTWREGAWTTAIGSLAYLALGPLLLAWAYRRFDRLLDRPRRPLIAFAPGRPTSAAPAIVARASPPAGPAG